jgi:hypothetical protein
MDGTLLTPATAAIAAVATAEATPAPATTEEKQSITLDSFVLGILKKKATQGESAFKKHLGVMAAAFGCEASEVNAAYETAIAAEKARAEAEAKAQRILAKKVKADKWAEENLKTFTVPKSIITLLEKARDAGKNLCDADSQVTLTPTFTLNEKGEVVVGLSSTGLSSSGGGAPRQTSGDKSEKSRISPWVAYQDGVKKGDTFRITRLDAGKFRDETRGEDIPNKGFTKWIRSYYPTSNTATILKGYGQL